MAMHARCWCAGDGDTPPPRLQPLTDWFQTALGVSLLQQQSVLSVQVRLFPLPCCLQALIFGCVPGRGIAAARTHVRIPHV
jgi:hypothetical protein